MAELLLELLSEEIPARMQARAADDLKRLACDGMKAAGLEFGRAETYATPRRLALVVDGIPESQPDLREERRGPRVDAPDKAIQGFLGSVGLTRDQVEERETDKGTFLYVVIEKKGAATADVLPSILREAIWNVPWPKSMRWADERSFRWVRPLQNVLCIFGRDVLKFELGRPIGEGRIEVDFQVAGGLLSQIQVGNKTVGHRFLAPEPFTVKDFADYKAKLARAKVILDPAERRATIESSLEKLAKAEGFTVKADPGLLDEVTGLVEWPVVLLGRIEPGFMELPDEVLTASMRGHQKYFSLLAKDGALAPRFGMVANMEAADGGARIVSGNERVLRARLADAKFFWDQDRRRTLASRAPQLEQIVFHARLGTIDEKVDRVQALAGELVKYVNGADRDRVRSAARLCKADLVTGMVGEFPELQGTMGRYYALHDGEHREVADAVAEHYAPLGPSDACPSAPVSVCVALADKIDTLVSFWLIDEKPTGSRDPFALRRAALGVIRLVVENGLRMPLGKVFAAAHAIIAESQDKRTHPERMADAGGVLSDLLDFFADRLKVHLRERGVRHDLISAVFAVGGEDDLVRLLARVDALEGFLHSDDGANLLIAYKRAANIVRIEERKDKAAYNGGADKAAFTQSEEAALYDALADASSRAGTALAAEDFTGAMRAIAGLRRPVDAFFDHVTVNADDRSLRVNRLRLLSAIGGALHNVADFSRIEG